MATTKPLSTWNVADGLPALPSLGPYANEAARLAATQNAQAVNFSSADLGRVVQQTDTGAYWIIESVTAGVPRWRLFSGPIPIRPQAGAGAYLATINDIGALVPMTSASANAPTIQQNSAVPASIGDSIMFEQQGAGLLTLTPGSGVTFEGNYTGTPAAAVSAGVGSVIVATQRALNVWVIYGKTT
jgi:hypothetical protein